MRELVLRAPQALVEPVCDALIDHLGALAVSVEDADADGPAERALFGEPGLPAPPPAWQVSTLQALFDDEAQATAAATRLLAQDWSASAARGATNRWRSCQPTNPARVLAWVPAARPSASPAPAQSA
jgi:ribosomal protein L11 methyltransferase